jgi:hypothetical protein
MRTIPFVDWIANAAAHWVGPRGAVTAKAQATGCSRQCVYDHAHKVLATVQAEHNGGPTREELIQENAALRRENAQLWDWLFQTIEFPLAKQQQFAVTALAMGLSLNTAGPSWLGSNRPAWFGSWGPRPRTTRARPGR